MAKKTSLCLLFLSFLIFFYSGNSAFSTSTGTRFLKKNKISKSQIQFFTTNHKIWKTLSNSNMFRRTLEETNNNSPTTTNPTSTTQAITPPETPTIITVPSTNPVTVSPTNPGSTPVTTVPSTTPPTNPATSPVPVTNPVTSPVTGTVPVNSYPPPSPLSGTVPVTNPPPSNTNSQGSWCVAKTGVPQTTLQTALDYACGTKGADCSQIQQGGSCYNPNSLQNHASFAFNSYYIKNPAATSCDFGGVATIVSTNPSSGTCIFPSSSGGTSTPGSGTTTSPSAGFGPQSSPFDSSHSTNLRPLLGCMVLVILSVTGRVGISA